MRKQSYEKDIISRDLVGIRRGGGLYKRGGKEENFRHTEVREAREQGVIGETYIYS